MGKFKKGDNVIITTDRWRRCSFHKGDLAVVQDCIDIDGTIYIVRKDKGHGLFIDEKDIALAATIQGIDIEVEVPSTKKARRYHRIIKELTKE